jgi:nicotinamidase/pyrazinamidase
MVGKKILFWNVDTQEDFIDPGGKLYVKGAETIRPILKAITEFAKAGGIRVINTCDYHQINAAEISTNPDFITHFPPHCMAGTAGAHFITETDPETPAVIDWDSELAIISEFDDAVRFRNIVLRKDAFDVFAGNPQTEKIVQIINPDCVFVYGVTTNICVDKVVVGLSERGFKVYVLEDAIKELPNIPLPFGTWKSLGVEMIPFSDLRKYM